MHPASVRITRHRQGAQTRAPLLEPGCVTVLSTYNKETTCWLHSVPVHRHPLETR
jgi:hypothetical protein